jgi:hypothetical protein
MESQNKLPVPHLAIRSNTQRLSGNTEVSDSSRRLSGNIEPKPKEYDLKIIVEVRNE